jgi:hypothetical protein
MTQCKGTSAKTGRPAEQPALYVNYFEVGHNPFEFLLDLGQYHPGSSESEGCIAIHTRIAFAPTYAKMLSDLLARAINEHESQHGKIANVGPEANPFEIVLSSLDDFENRARALRTAGAHAPPPKTRRRPATAPDLSATSEADDQ